MSGKYDANAFSPGDIMRRLRELEQKVRELVSGRRLENASVGAGGIRVHSGGGVRVHEGGDITVEDGGDITVEDGGNLVISGGGGVHVLDGGRIEARYPDGTGAIQFGSTVNQATGEPSGHGLVIQDVNGNDIFRAKRDQFGRRQVVVGSDLGDADLFYVTASQFQLGTDTDGVLICDGTQNVFLQTPPGDNQLILDGDAHTFIGSGGQLVTQSAQTTFIITDSDIQLDSGTNNVWVKTTGGGGTANVELTGAANTMGLLRRVSSSLRYKQDVEDYTADIDAVLRMRPRMWRSRADVEVDPATEARHVGFIAEELDELGLYEFVSYDEQDRPESIAYDRLTAALLQVIQHQQRQIEDLTERVGRLDGGPKRPRPAPRASVDRETKRRQRRCVSTAPKPQPAATPAKRSGGG